MRRPACLIAVESETVFATAVNRGYRGNGGNTAVQVMAELFTAVTVTINKNGDGNGNNSSYRYRNRYR